MVVDGVADGKGRRDPVRPPGRFARGGGRGRCAAQGGREQRLDHLRHNADVTRRRRPAARATFVLPRPGRPTGVYDHCPLARAWSFDDFSM